MKWTEREAPKAAMATLNLVSGITLWSEMIRDRREFCLNKCQNNKVVNMLRPKCTERRYLDVLLLSRETKKNMPLFCYSQRTKGLMRSFQENEPLSPDVYIYIDDYWKIIQDKHSTTRQTASDFLKRTLIKGREVLPMGSDQLIDTHLIRDQLFLLWPKLDLCLVNAQETSIHSIKMFRSICEALAEAYGLEIIIDIDRDNIELRFENLSLKKPEIVESTLQISPFFTGFSTSEIWAEIQLPDEFVEEEHEIKVKDLHLVFKTVLEAIELVSESEKASVVVNEPSGLTSVPKEKDREIVQK